MAKIAILSQHLVNKIAAGEVVERPASVVKELLENSLDAGATRISIEIEDGGKKLIRLADNGGGMNGADLALAFVPHATSKIATDDDLFAIRTMGFRGEALASIAAISQVEAVSRTADAIEGARLEIAGGQTDPVQPAAAAPGTTIAVRNLFFNTPARRKFLRATNTELGHITEQFTRIALAHTHVHLTLLHNGRVLYDLPADQSLLQRIGQLFTAELADGLLPVERRDPTRSVHGLIGRPQHARANTQWQFIFLNGRYIRDRFISHAIRESYRGMLDASRQPVVFLFLEMDPASVDVNVHPTKAEVRFADSNRVHSQVLAALRDRLLSTDLSVPVTGAGVGTDPPTGETEEGETLSEQQQRVRQAMADFFKTHQPGPSSAAGGSATGGVGAGGSVATGPGAGGDAAGVAPGQRPRPAEAVRPAPAEHKDRPAEEGLFGQAGQAGADAAATPVSAGPVMQVHDSYIVVQTPAGLAVIDQHALHERILFQKLHAELSHGSLPAQHCLIPETVDVTARQMAVLDEHADTLRHLGILIEPFGPHSVAIQAFPAMLERASPVPLVADVLDLLAEQAGKISRQQLLHEIIAVIACKAAVKAGDPLTPGEIQALLAQKPLTESQGSCPHGRPTTITLSLKELEKQFKRT